MPLKLVHFHNYTAKLCPLAKSQKHQPCLGVPRNIAQLLRFIHFAICYTFFPKLTFQFQLQQGSICTLKEEALQVSSVLCLGSLLPPLSLHSNFLLHTGSSKGLGQLSQASFDL
jgi:hypothetical protein